MACDGSSKISITTSDNISSQTKHDSEYPPSVQSEILSAIQKIRKSKNRADVKAITKKINKTNGTSFEEGCIAVNISQLLHKKIITNVKTQQNLDSFRLSTTEIPSEENLLSQVEEITLDDSLQRQQNTHFISILLDDIINNALCNLDKSSDEIKITTPHKRSTFVQQSTSDDTLTPIANDMHTPITKNDHASICASIVDEGFKKLELQIYELNKSVNSE